MSSKRKKRRDQCGKKRKWPTQEAAQKHARFLKARHPNEFFDPYLCGHCGSFHTGHRIQSVRSAIKARREQ